MIGSLVGLFCALLVFLNLSFFPGAYKTMSNIPAQIVVNGQPAGGKSVIVYQQGGEFLCNIPLSVTLKALGCDFTWEDNDKARIEIESKVFFLIGNKLIDNEGKTLCKDDRLKYHGFDTERDPLEIFLEHKTMENFLHMIGINPLEIVIDPIGKTVSITTIIC